MANPTWTDGDANWTTAADWSTGTVPGAGDNVTIPNVDAFTGPEVTTNVGTVASLTNDEDLTITNGGTLAVSGNLINGVELMLDPASGSGGSRLSVGGILTNYGVLSIGSANASAPPDTVTTGGLINTGQVSAVDITGGTNGTSSLIVNAPAGFGTQGVLSGKVFLSGNALIEFSSGLITSTATGSNLFLSGPNAHIADAGSVSSNSALALSNNDGTLILGSGAMLSTPGALSNIGEIDVGVGTATTSTLTINSAPGFGTGGIITGAVRLDNYGTIAFTQAGQLTSIAANSSLVINGTMNAITAPGSSGQYGVLNLASNAGGFELDNTSYSVGGSFTNTGGIAVRDGGSFAIGGSLTSSDSIDVEGSTLSVGGVLTNSGYVTIGTQGSTETMPVPPAAGTSVLQVGALSLTGGTFYIGSSANVQTSNVALSGSATLDLAGPSNSLASGITFASGARATLEIDAAEIPASGGSLSNTISAFSQNDTIDLRSLSFVAGATTATLNGSTLTITNGSATDTLTLSNPGATGFATSQDAYGGTQIVICFATGTQIRTSRGDVPVEALRVADLATTASGGHRSVRWIGHRTIENPTFDQGPVRIRAGAFGADLPERDLYLSPGHPILVGDHLVPVMCLINGTTIARHPVESVTYWHVELDQHDILLADGLACESYFDMGSRPWFGGSNAPLHDPEFVSADMPGRCRPVAIDGPVVEAERRRLDALFAARLMEPCSWPSSNEGELAS